MGSLRDTLTSYVDDGSVAGAIGLIARGDQIDAQAVGSVDVEGSAPMRRDSIFRLASATKPITAAALMMLIDDGRLALTDPIANWLPELAAPRVVRTPAGPVDDLVPANRPITVFDLLSFHAGYGLAADFSLPALQLLLDKAQRNTRDPKLAPGPDEWLAILADIPMISQPGEAWLYNTGSDLQGVLIARVAGQPLPEFLAERLFEPLGMVDTGFSVPAAKLGRFTSYYQPDEDGKLELLDTPDGQWSTPSVFASGAGGLVSTADDWLRFARLILAKGTVDGRRFLSPESVRAMTTDHTTPAERAANTVFLEGQGWGFGGSVDVETINPWNVPGRYGWVGGSGTAAHLIPSTGKVTIVLTQTQMTNPSPTPIMRAFWRHAATVG
ncbi:MAG TPA: serine hydrolase domain-containing protein [Pseudonocardiaceae bacterium]|jgi:CubicO group peptidase (beta-lactamase class C family)|nr:serine hydrolase domain-containing protein [Pseudonocardiaceae bacterium]